MDIVFLGYLIFVFIVSFAMLVKGSDIFIDGAATIAMRKGVSEHMIGLTLVAFATSIPELALSDTAALHGVEGIAIGSVIGSNIANIGLVLGIAIIIMPVTSPRKSLMDGVFLLGITTLLALVMLDGELGRVDGAVFLVIYGVFIYYLIKRHTFNSDRLTKLDEKAVLKAPLRKEWLMVGAGAAMVLVGAHYLVESAVDVAEMVGISSFIIGLTIVSIGTSLPELASSVSAALKKKHGISVGNVIGSNIINILLVLGTASMIRPIGVEGDEFNFSMPFLFLFTIICVLLVRTKMPRWSGVGLLVLYGLFLGVLVLCWGGI
ncbi:MAG: calcium/sodium antiporter [Thermoplasmata archaeon]|nr:calcium/sodium antiporter [Thermoplasmata archaeon]